MLRQFSTVDTIALVRKVLRTKLLEVHACTNSIEVQEDSTLVKAEENSKSPGVVCSSISGETIETVLIKDESHSQGAKADEDKSTMKCSFPTSSKYIAIEHNYSKRE